MGARGVCLPRGVSNTAAHPSCWGPCLTQSGRGKTQDMGVKARIRWAMQGAFSIGCRVDQKKQTRANQSRAEQIKLDQTSKPCLGGETHNKYRRKRSKMKMVNYLKVMEGRAGGYFP